MAETADSTVSTVALPAGGVDFDFKYHCLTLNSGDRIQVVAVAFIDDRLLIAAPQTAWHRRTSSKRVLPTLTKPCLVEVGCVEDVDRSVLHQTEMVKVWMGFIPPELIALMEEEGADVTYEHLLLDSALEGFYPSGEGLVAAAAEHFAFQSATGGEDLSVIEDVSGSHAMESRLGRLENLVGNLAAKLEAALPVPQTVDAQPKGSRPSALRKSGKQKEDPPHVSFPSLDPSVVASAIAAGVDTQSLQQMQSMMDQPGIKGKKVAEP